MLPRDPHALPDVEVDEHVFGRRGLLGVSRRKLAVLAATVCFASVAIHDLPASAATVHEEEVLASAQSFASSRIAEGQVATRDGFDVSSYTVVQWPLDPASPMSSGFGPRRAACGGCSTNHHGVDWTPGAGVPIEAIADGVVVGVDSLGSTLGVHVVIEHDVDGVVWRSLYAHMQRGSSGLAVGQHVTRGSLVGRVGNTGVTSGTHLHFGITDAAGTYVDPLAWLHRHVTQAWGE